MCGYAEFRIFVYLVGLIELQNGNKNLIAGKFFSS
jgi:hypothetical protein